MTGHGYTSALRNIAPTALNKKAYNNDELNDWAVEYGFCTPGECDVADEIIDLEGDWWETPYFTILQDEWLDEIWRRTPTKYDPTITANKGEEFD